MYQVCLNVTPLCYIKVEIDAMVYLLDGKLVFDVCKEFEEQKK